MEEEILHVPLTLGNEGRLDFYAPSGLAGFHHARAEGQEVEAVLALIIGNPLEDNRLIMSLDVLDEKDSSAGKRNRLRDIRAGAHHDTLDSAEGQAMYLPVFEIFTWVQADRTAAVIATI